MTDFEHFIITRFNLKNKVWEIDKNNQKVLNESWLEFRYDIFLKSCFNSLKNQSNLNFKWLVYFDTDTPEKYKKLNKELSDQFSQFKPVYKNSNNAFIKDLLKDIDLFKSDDTATHLITTRIDNDDAFHFKTIETIQNSFNYQNKVIVNLSWIYCYNIIKQQTTKHLFLSNPFISLIELYNRDFERDTVFSRNHTDWKKDTDILRVESGGVFCLQIIHDRNILNKMSGTYVKNTELANEFNLLFEVNYNKLYFIKVFYSNFMVLLNKRKKQLKRKCSNFFKK